MQESRAIESNATVTYSVVLDERDVERLLALSIRFVSVDNK